MESKPFTRELYFQFREDVKHHLVCFEPFASVSLFEWFKCRHRCAVSDTSRCSEAKVKKGFDTNNNDPISGVKGIFRQVNDWVACEKAEDKSAVKRRLL